VEEIAALLDSRLCDSDAASVLVIGTEEFMHLPLSAAAVLARRGRSAWSSSTTRSPVVAIDDAGYAIRSVVSYSSVLGGPFDRFIYNVAPFAESPRPAMIVMYGPESAALTDLSGLAERLCPHAERVLIVRVEVVK